MNIIIDWLLLRPFWKPLVTGNRRVILRLSDEVTGKKEIIVDYWTEEEKVLFIKEWFNPSTNLQE